jgi:hypothetical protein
MDTPIERTITIWIDDKGELHWQHSGLAPIEIMGILAMVQHYAMADLQLTEEKKTDERALLDALGAMRGN